jgi:hypothetical protein
MRPSVDLIVAINAALREPDDLFDSNSNKKSSEAERKAKGAAKGREERCIGLELARCRLQQPQWLPRGVCVKPMVLPNASWLGSSESHNLQSQRGKRGLARRKILKWSNI